MIEELRMPKKTIALIIGLVIVTIILFVIALNNNDQQVQPQQQDTVSTTQGPTPTPDAQTVLYLSPGSVSVVSGKQGTADVIMETNGNSVTAVQLELQYDPKQVSNVVLNPGPLFPNPVVLINNNDVKTGRITYAFGIQPNQQTISGTGTVAIITFTGRGKVGQQAQISFLPTSLVTARGIATSVLKDATGTVINFTTTAQVQATVTPSVANAAVSPVVTAAPTVATQQ